MATTDASMFWELIEELQHEDPRVEEGTIMGGLCARVAGEFLGLVDFKGSGRHVTLPRPREQDLLDPGAGPPSAPAGNGFTDWVPNPQRDRRRWRALLHEGTAFDAPS
mgnify:CR=1 FL=1